MGKYTPLQKYLEAQTAGKLTLRMEQIERILQDALPASAYRHVAWWSNGVTHRHVQCLAWMESGYRTVGVDQTIRSGYIQFERI